MAKPKQTETKLANPELVQKAKETAFDNFMDDFEAADKSPNRQAKDIKDIVVPLGIRFDDVQKALETPRSDGKTPKELILAKSNDPSEVRSRLMMFAEALAEYEEPSVDKGEALPDDPFESGEWAKSSEELQEKETAKTKAEAAALEEQIGDWMEAHQGDVDAENMKDKQTAQTYKGIAEKQATPSKDQRAPEDTMVDMDEF